MISRTQAGCAANHRPKIFRAYRLVPDHKLINLEAANAQLLSCGVADSETTHGHRAIANAPMAAAPAASAPVASARNATPPAAMPLTAMPLT